MKYLQQILLCLGVVSTAAPAVAQTFSVPLQAGSTDTESLEGARGYVCVLSDTNGSYRLSRNVLGPGGQPITAKYPKANADILKSQFSTAVNFGDTTPGDNLIVFNTLQGPDGFGDYTFELEAVGAMSVNPNLRCIDTAFVCGFNTFLSDAIFLEVSNNGFFQLDFVYRWVDFDGNSTDVRESVPPGVRRDFRIDESIARGKYGSVIFLPENSFFLGEDMTVRVSHYRNGALQGSETCQSLAVGFFQ